MGQKAQRHLVGELLLPAHFRPDPRREQQHVAVHLTVGYGGLSCGIQPGTVCGTGLV